jgi:hypothetical protein
VPSAGLFRRDGCRRRSGCPVSQASVAAKARATEVGGRLPTNPVAHEFTVHARLAATPLCDRRHFPLKDKDLT